jgi:hypothetical protein
MKTKPHAIVSSQLAALFILGALALPSEAGCSGGGCSRVFSSCGSGPTSFKGGAARLPKVTAVADNSITVGDKKTYLIGPDSRITIDGNPATWSDLKPGMGVLVNGKMIERGADAKASFYRASRITARTK